MLRYSLAAIGLMTLLAVAARADDRLVVHEWGTFTALEDEKGEPIGGINTDDEPLPAFVHDLNGMILGPSEVPAILMKGIPRCDPDVLVRLETPVIYFHPPANAASPIKLDVDVKFHGGWLTQYYPNAEVAAPGLHRLDGDGNYGTLTAANDGTLSWHGLTIGPARPGPATTAPVWLAPRAVAAADVTTAKNECERFLFYRGVGHLAPPIRVLQDGPDVKIQSDLPAALRYLWLLDVKSDGRCAMSSLGSGVDKSDDADTIMCSATFNSDEYSTDNIAVIRQALTTQMLRAGLFADETRALLNTWDASYFRRPGLRLFFVVPQEWTDRVLPLHLSVGADIKRVMIGRIEIVTPQQRALLSPIAKGPASNPGNWLTAALRQASGNREDYYRQEWFQRVMDGQTSLTSLHIDMPDDFRDYLRLGRFRNALILDEAKRRPTAALTQFIKNYELQATGR